MTGSERIAEFAVALHYEDLPAETVAAAKLHAELESAVLALESAETLAPFAILGQAREPCRDACRSQRRGRRRRDGAGRRERRSCGGSQHGSAGPRVPTQQLERARNE
jgi:hypothetical protein